MYTDGTLAGFDATIKTATDANTNLAAEIADYQNIYIPGAQAAAQYAAAGNGPNFVIEYNKLQDFNKKWLNQPAVYLSSGPTHPDPASAAGFNNAVNTAQTQVNNLQDQVTANNKTISDATAARLAYWNSLPAAVTSSIQNESAADLATAQTAQAAEQIQTQQATLATTKTKVILYVGVGLAVVIVGVIIFFVVKKTKPKPE